MEDPLASPSAGRSKAEEVADAINRLLREVTIRCAKQGGVQHLFDVGVVGYGESVRPAFAGRLAGRELVPIGEVSVEPLRIEQRRKRVTSASAKSWRR